MLPPADLKSLLQNIRRGSTSHQELSRLIQVCRAIVESHLSSRRASLIHVFSLYGLSIGDLALDCIAEIFLRDEEGNFQRLEAFIRSLDDPLEGISDVKLFLAFKSFVLKIGGAQLARIYAQTDPMGAKILRNIRDTEKKLGIIIVEEDFRGLIMKPRDAEALDHLAAFPLTELESQFFAQIGADLSTPSLLKVLVSILKMQTGYRRSVSLIDIVQLFKKVYDRWTAPEDIDGLMAGLATIEQEELDLLRRQVLAEVDEKILSTYLLKGKLNRSEAQILAQTMRSIIDEWFEGNQIEDSYYRHLAEHTSVSTEQYESLWRKKVEYLARVARESILNFIRGNF